MSSANLINVNVDVLFEQHSVAEIDIVQKKIQAVVEDKREELRQMVGERYRDLLQAADTIAAMQDSSNTLIAQVVSITNNCRTLNEQQLIGFKTADAEEEFRSRSANKQQNNYFSTMIQIKLLTALPELIWSCLDQAHFYTATELFIFSRHISTGLQLDVNNKLIHSLPVAKKQWEILKPFHTTIKQYVLVQLDREELTPTVLTDCLLSLLLLEKSSLNGVLKTFLQLRAAAFLDTLTDASRGEDTKRRVKERILASLKVLYGTIELIRKCFLENGLLLQKLAEISSHNTVASITHMDSNDRQFSHLLPDIIANFRPKLDVQALDEVQVSDAIEQWLAQITRTSSAELRQLFELVATMNTIQELKTEANTSQNASNFSALANMCRLSDSLNFYETKYAPLINERVRDIIRDNWKQAMNDTFSALQHALDITLQDNGSQSSSLVQSLWENSTDDLPRSLAEALSSDRKLNKLDMKLKGYTEDIISICTNFDNQLSAIVEELQLLLDDQSMKSDEKQGLLEFLRMVAENELTDFITKVKTLNLEQSQRQALLLMVRLLAALIELCPNLKICFCQQSSWRHNVDQSSHNAADAWHRVGLLIEEEIMQFWLKIIKGILEENLCENVLPQKIDHKTVLQDFAKWETVALEQKDDQENPLHTTFRIPSQPRFSIQTYLFRIIRSLISSIPQSLPPSVLPTFNEHLLRQILSHYESLTASTQHVALQLYFDLKFLLKLFAVSRNNDDIYEKFQALISKLKEGIDPFDFELFEEHLSTNVKRSVCRLSCLFGVLVPNTAAASIATSASSFTQERDPNILSLSSSDSTSLWFPLLPIVEPGSESDTIATLETISPAASEKQTTPTRKPTTSTRKNDAAKSKSGAAYFFGAMSQDWFGR